MAKVINQIKPMVFENPDTGKKLIAEYNRATILQMDRLGVIGNDFLANATRSPLTVASVLFYWGLKLHQPEITQEEADELLFDEIGLGDDVLERLSELFMTPYTSIIDARKNSRWTVK